MPQGYETRTYYGDPMRAYSLPGFVGAPWSQTALPLTGIDYVYTYRSGKRAKSLLLEKKRDPFSSSGSLIDDLSRRKEFLEKIVNEIIVDPSVGSPSVFSLTDVGHPFASLKVRTDQPQGWCRLTTTATGVPRSYTDLSFTMGEMPIPLLSDPFGFGYENGQAFLRFSYFHWPLSFAGSADVPLARQVVSQSFHKSLATGLIASANPWAPKASLAVTVMELLTGDVPSVFKNLRRYLTDLQSLKKTAGSDWLNVQFGWVPLISDIMDAVKVLYQLHLLLYGSNERRRGREGDLGTWSRFIDSTPSVSARNPILGSALGQKVVDTVGSASSPPNIAPPTGRWSRTFTVRADYRFSARYHRGARPNQTEFSYIDRAVELLGLELTPDVLWQLTPWTWLLDWATNLGSISQNLSTLDWSNVLLDYAYLTYRIRTDSSMSVVTPGRWTQGTALTYESPLFLSNRVTTDEKIREQASPFGFSVNWNGLSPFQLSILAALGMSRGR